MYTRYASRLEVGTSVYFLPKTCCLGPPIASRRCLSLNMGTFRVSCSCITLIGLPLCVGKFRHNCADTLKD